MGTSVTSLRRARANAVGARKPRRRGADAGAGLHLAITTVERLPREPPRRGTVRTVAFEIVPAGPDRVGDLSSLLARAFVDDPQISWPLPAAGAERVSTLMFRWLLEGYVDLGFVWQATDPLGRSLGCAAWLPPGRSKELELLDRASRPRIAELTDDGGARYDAMWDWIEGQIPDEPIWFLDMIAVEEAARGTGVGSALLHLGLDSARTDGVPAFLETGNAGNVAMYEHFGFRVVLEGDVPGGGPHIWFMST
jgi:GNAT superfamily N-acetyltransferase